MEEYIHEGDISQLDIDLHYGDGTANTFSGSPEVTYFHPEGYDRNAFMETLTSLEGLR